MSLHGTCCSLLGEFNRVATHVMQPLLSLYPSPHLFLSLGMGEAWVLCRVAGLQRPPPPVCCAWHIGVLACKSSLE